jgi:hypothetical protein
MTLTGIVPILRPPACGTKEPAATGRHVTGRRGPAPDETVQAVARRMLGCQPRLLDGPRDGTERRLKLFWRGIPSDRDDDREAIPERPADHRRDSKSQAWRPLVRKVHLK